MDYMVDISVDQETIYPRSRVLDSSTTSKLLVARALSASSTLKPASHVNMVFRSNQLNQLPKIMWESFRSLMSASSLAHGSAK
jgi:hypothetical protein